MSKRKQIESYFFAVAYSYLRFSHPDQAKGDSFRRQIANRDAWLQRNRVKLDTTLTLEDKGISGFTGEHRNNPDRHALAAFLYAVEKKRIPRGSYLIVENLDRLSREDILPALTLVLNLIQSGIRIVQLLPVEMVYDENANPMQLMMMIMELSRGHSESQMKSERVGGAWQEKKRRAAENGEPLTARTPAWLRLVNGEWEVNEEAADTIRRIYRLARDGYGIGVITKKLNAEHVPVVGRAAHWARSYVAKLLGNRAVIGEYQPYKGRGRKRVKDGKPIPGYFEAILTEEEWYATRAAMASRRGKVGRPAKAHVNTFAGLLYDARGGTLQQASKGRKGGGQLLVPYRAVQGAEGSRYSSFPFAVFEAAVLRCLREINPREILPPENDGADKIMALSGRLAEIEADIEKIKTRLRGRYSDALADVLERQETEQRTLIEQLSAASQEAASPLSKAWGECRSLLDALNAAPDDNDARLRLRAAVRRIVEGFWCLFLTRGRTRIAAVQVWFTGGAHRSYAILYQQATGGAVGTRPARWDVRAMRSEPIPTEVPPELEWEGIGGYDGLDLRRPADAALLERLIGSAKSLEQVLFKLVGEDALLAALLNPKAIDSGTSES